QIGSKEIAEAFFQVETGDRLLLMSDGVVNAGVGGIYKLGLGTNGVVTNLRERGLEAADAQIIADEVINLVDACYLCCPGDDATTVALVARPPRTAVVLTGPPARPEDDRKLIDYFLHYQGEQRIVCGGATGNLVARETRNSIKTSLEYIDPSVPPTAEIAGMDLVTEGILTLNKCIEKLQTVVRGGRLAGSGDGATRLAQQLLKADRIVFLVGSAVNPAHETFMHSLQLATRFEAVDSLVDLLGTLEKEVIVEQF
ncbi:MAG TPA: stage II sporulation protein E, partial [Bacillota bacterium]|nr:stage II sporulation protein E [Bacillota bacterium]